MENKVAKLEPFDFFIRYFPSATGLVHSVQEIDWDYIQCHGKQKVIAQSGLGVNLITQIFLALYQDYFQSKGEWKSSCCK